MPYRRIPISDEHCNVALSNANEPATYDIALGKR